MRTQAHAVTSCTGSGIRRWPLVAALMAALFLAGNHPASSAWAAREESRKPLASESVWTVIAVYLINFSRFATWPEVEGLPEDAPMRIGLLLKSKAGIEIEGRMNGRLVGKRPIHIVRGSSIEEFADCQLIFVDDPDKARDVADTLAGQPKLIVTYSPTGFAKTGCGIELVLVGENIRYILNHGALKAQRIEPSAGLMTNAYDQRKDPVPEAPAQHNDGTPTARKEEAP